MKGMVFKVFETHVVRHLGEDVLDELLEHPGLSTAGAYSSVGNYPHDDLLCMVSALSARTGQPVSDLVRTFGFELFGALADGHAEIMQKFDGCLAMLAGIESVIHRDVRKLYSDAELPRFDVEIHDGERHLRLVYRSSRPFADLAEGLIHGALSHYRVNENARVQRENLSDDGSAARFDITLNSG